VSDRLGEANALNSLGNLETKQKNNDLARQHYSEACRLYQQIGAMREAANVLSILGNLEMQQGHMDLARQYLGEARSLFHQIGQRLLEALVLGILGTLENQQRSNDLARGGLHRSSRSLSERTLQAGRSRYAQFPGRTGEPTAE
jgi:tetratricopeptide (TPR) repeat protein